MAIGSAFISHKHRDKEIAVVVGEFITSQSANRVDVFLSSDARFQGPRPGTKLDDALEQGIDDSGVVFLVYTGTSAGRDWDYCIYECATARNKGLRVIVLKFVDEAPAPFLGTVLTNVTDKEDVYKLTKDFLTAEDFFRGQQETVTQYTPDHPTVKERADALHAMFEDAIRDHLGGEPHRWSAWPSMRLELTTLEYPKDASPGERVELVREHLLAAAVVVESSGADQIFGLGVDDGQPFSSLVESWLDSYPDNDQAWLDSLAEQIEAFFRRRFPALREVRLPEVQGSRSVVPVVTDMLSDPQREERQFDVEFYDIHPLSPPIRGIMIDRGEIYSRRMEADGTQSLADIRRDMKAKNIHRLPVFDDGWRALYMVHRSVISEFLLDSDGADLTLNDLLGRPGAEDSLGGSFAFCSPDTTVEQAREDLAAIEGARDVFVTASGNRSEPVLGMVANTDLERSA